MLPGRSLTIAVNHYLQIENSLNCLDIGSTCIIYWEKKTKPPPTILLLNLVKGHWDAISAISKINSMSERSDSNS